LKYGNKMNYDIQNAKKDSAVSMFSVWRQLLQARTRGVYKYI